MLLVETPLVYDPLLKNPLNEAKNELSYFKGSTITARFSLGISTTVSIFYVLIDLLLMFVMISL